ncbi:TetR/AcrR family transcriptional regulator [Nocardioides caeni]|uniref:TetR/AcrR family transcriptional regulator n=1 Tax=Nocardioides caeni TaxID=574700 RepID=A0A4S8N921_9ACTN|nr:TetR/AcrR family transcriptional regulator [Nocardioides caeni]THV11204.1 TetR/AcrR family transcriptional regulator [Nocardioides caeni]
MKHADLRQRLLRAAEQEIMANGLARTSLRGIARRVGVSHQATAHHFDDRAGLFTALAIEGFETLEARTRTAIATFAEPGGEQVAIAGVAYLEFARRHPTMFDVMFRPELVHVDDERLAAARGSHLALTIDTLTAARATGWGPDLPVEELAALSWATVHGLAVLQRDAHLVAAHPLVDAPGDLLQRVAAALDALA